MTHEFNTNEMDENIDMLEERVMDCLNNTDFKGIFSKLSSLKQPTMFVGSGGSSVASKFIAAVVNEKNNIISEAKIPDEVWIQRNKGYRNMVVMSSSGMNPGARVAAEKASSEGVNVMIMSGSDRVPEEGNIKYKKTTKNEDSFISFADTLIPMAVALTYYIGSVEKTKTMIMTMFEKLRENRIDYPISDIYEIIGKDRFPTASAFVESTMSESGIATATISGTYDELHGRTTSILQQKNRRLIYLLPEETTEIDKFLHERTGEYISASRITDVPAIYNNYILADFYLTLQMIQFCALIARKKGVDLSEMSDANGRRHIGPNPDAVETFKIINGRSCDSPEDFSALTKKSVDDDDERPLGYFGPTGRFLEVLNVKLGRGGK